MHHRKSLVCRGVAVVLTICHLGWAHPAEAGVFNVDGYEVEIQSKYIRSEAKLIAKGTIRGGHQCRNLEVKMLFTNGNELITAIKSIINYEPTKEGVSFKHKEGYALLPSDKDLVKRWRAYRVKLKCVQ